MCNRCGGQLNTGGVCVSCGFYANQCNITYTIGKVEPYITLSRLKEIAGSERYKASQDPLGRDGFLERAQILEQLIRELEEQQ